MELQEAVLQRVPEFDFTKTRGLAFVHTMSAALILEFGEN